MHTIQKFELIPKCVLLEYKVVALVKHWNLNEIRFVIHYVGLVELIHLINPKPILIGQLTCNNINSCGKLDSNLLHFLKINGEYHVGCSYLSYKRKFISKFTQ